MISAVGQRWDTLQLGSAGTLCGWALKGYSAVGHCTKGEENVDVLKLNKPNVRVGNKELRILFISRFLYTDRL